MYVYIHIYTCPSATTGDQTDAPGGDTGGGHTYVCIHVYIYIYLSISCVCVCVCAIYIDIYTYKYIPVHQRRRG